MWILLATVFLASLVGSLHCVGMCGPFALIASADPDRRAPLLAPTAAYSVGRLITYGLVGAIFGSLGLALNKSFALASWQQSATYIAGGSLVIIGLIAGARALGWRIVGLKFATGLQRLLQAGFRRTVNLPPVKRALVIGLLTTLMPCGWLYTFALAAAATASPLLGAALMASFWLGTVPILIALCLGWNKVSRSIQKRVPLATASLVIALGVFTLVYRAPISVDSIQAGSLPAAGGDFTAVSEQIEVIDHSVLPCCEGR